MKKLTFKVIPHKKQRYDTVGDYWETRTGVEFRVSKMSNERYELLVFFHEFIEYVLVLWHGISVWEIDQFDKHYEKARKNHQRNECGCKPTDFSEPGNDVHAPYHKEHMWATRFEWVLAKLLHVHWDSYADEVNSLVY